MEAKKKGWEVGVLSSPHAHTVVSRAAETLKAAWSFSELNLKLTSSSVPGTQMGHKNLRCCFKGQPLWELQHQRRAGVRGGPANLGRGADGHCLYLSCYLWGAVQGTPR